jgi:conjugative transfer signal peptidase TraF
MTMARSIAPLSPRWRELVFLFIALCIPGAIAIAGLAGYRVNLTPSEPLGLWRVRLMQRPAVVGDLVFVCPPQRADMEEASRRGYLRYGACPGGFAPLIKTIAAVAGQHVAIDGSVSIDRVPLPHSILAPADGTGRILKPYSGGVVADGTVFLHSDFAGSYDSRYFGPVPSDGVIGLAQEVMTIAP